MKDQKSLELTEKEIDLILLLSKNFLQKKKKSYLGFGTIRRS